MKSIASPIFVVGTGRNGTRSIFRMLRGNTRIEAHHEYGCENIQKISCLYSMGLLNKDRALPLVREHYFAAINYCEKDIWLDSSNKASWIIPLLKDVFPASRFIHITRDPRRVVPSYYFKLREEMYDVKSTMKLAKWIDSGYHDEDAPPVEKKYWWKLQLDETCKVSSSEYQRSRFERCCLHWSSVIQEITKAFTKIPQSSNLTIRLEDLVSDNNTMQLLLDFLGLEYSDFYSQFLQKPRNVFLPLEFNCTYTQLKTLREYCDHDAKSLGYQLSDPLPTVTY